MGAMTAYNERYSKLLEACRAAKLNDVERAAFNLMEMRDAAVDIANIILEIEAGGGISATWIIQLESHLMHLRGHASKVLQVLRSANKSVAKRKDRTRHKK